MLLGARRDDHAAQARAEVPREAKEDLVGELGLGLQQREEVAAEENRELAGVERARLRRARRAVEERELAEEPPRAEFRDRTLRAALAADQHAAGAHDVQGIALLALVEDHLAGEVFALVQHALHDLELAQREVREERQRPQVLELAASRGTQEAEHGG